MQLVSNPAVTEIAQVPGTYYFDHPVAPGDPNIIYEVDGGAGLGDAERYLRGTITYGDDVELVQATLDSVEDRTSLIPADFDSRMDELRDRTARLLGLTKENAVLDDTIFDAQNNMTSGRFRIFASKADAVARLNPIAIYTIEASYVQGTNNLSSYQMVIEPIVT
jgi:hypothetical protein